jgi:hypothetical protein
MSSVKYESRPLVRVVKLHIASNTISMANAKATHLELKTDGTPTECEMKTVTQYYIEK